MPKWFNNWIRKIAMTQKLEQLAESTNQAVNVLLQANDTTQKALQAFTETGVKVDNTEVLAKIADLQTVLLAISEALTKIAADVTEVRSQVDVEDVVASDQKSA